MSAVLRTTTQIVLSETLTINNGRLKFSGWRLDEAASPRDGESGLREVRGPTAAQGCVNSDRIPWDCPSIVAGFSSSTRKGIAMSRLRKRMIQDMRLAGLVEGTRHQYLRAVRQLTTYYMVSPDRLSERHVEKYLLYIRDELGVARGTFVPTFFGLKFFYVQTLGHDWPLFTKKESASQASSGCPMSAVTPIAAA
jgi:hypothetical protein